MSEANKIRLGGLSMLPDDCKNCQIKKWCSGGYLPTRFSSENGYNNRSYYCSDLKNLFDHINIWLQKITIEMRQDYNIKKSNSKSQKNY